MTAPLRIGLLGASRIAPKAIIAPVRDDPRAEITAVAARDGAKARAYADTHGIAHAVEGYAALLARSDVDAVYSALPPGEHLQWSEAAARAGKAQLVEKPWALNAGHAQAMVEAAEAVGRPALEAFHYRFHPAFLQVEAWVREGRLGRITHASADFDAEIGRGPGELRWIRPLGGGALMDLGCYALHALRTLLGEPEVEAASCEVESGVDAATTARLRFGDTPAELRCDMRRPRRSVLTLEGERGRVEFDNYVSPHAFGRLTVELDGDPAREIPRDPRPTYSWQLDHLIDVCAGRAAPLTGGRDAVAQMRAIDAIYTAAGLGPIGG